MAGDNHRVINNPSFNSAAAENSKFVISYNIAGYVARRETAGGRKRGRKRHLSLSTWRLCARVRITNPLSFHLSACSLRVVRRARFRTFSYFLFVNKQSGAARRGVVRRGAPGAAAEVRQLIISINGHNSISNRARPRRILESRETGRKRPCILYLPRFPFPPRSPSLLVPPVLLFLTRTGKL